MKISNLINENLINLELDTKTKDETLVEMIKMIKDNGNITSVDCFKEDVFKREREGTTGVGMGLAIPHGKSEAVTKECFAIAKLKEPVEWNSLDGNPVSFVVMLAVPAEKATTLHLKLLSKLSYLLMDDDFRKRLMASNSKKELIDLISKREEE
ncbi:MAG TPA: PTS mannose transporter subunit IIAB [Clostridiaceae bacterium]|nr:PTS mannose transporter subunit IIAB [Clostridiaceae bacterium]